jgi:hypothetical protein
MAKSELYSSSLLPVALVAGILSGGLWRATPPADAGKSGESAGAADKAEVAVPPASWVSDLHPVMDSLSATLGIDPATLEAEDVARIKVVALEKTGNARDDQILRAMTELRTGLNASRGPGEFDCAKAEVQMKDAAAVLGASFLADDGGGVKTRTTAATALLNEYRDWRLLVSLARRVRDGQNRTTSPKYTVNFIVASIPDYVDSSSGWLADPELAAIQSGMTHSQYIFDRVKLVDWSRTALGSPTAMSSSRLHERQPGTLTFRRVDSNEVQLQVVLLVLETPTAGVHETALRNSLSFVRTWNACSGLGRDALRVLGPAFSGSTVSLASVLGDPAIKTWFKSRLVITGSATADDNCRQMTTFSGGADYFATVQPTSELIKRMAAFLAAMNADWRDGGRIAVLTESNTAYGGSHSSRSTLQNSMPNATEFSFPLHVAQLRSDAPAFAQPNGGLLPSAIIPLNLREPAPPADLVPALRPQLTSSIVESTVDSILDTIRHEKLTAVGIVATDDRDVLFLAREVKQAVPDVQLFLFGTHGLYLHHDYVPYLRGALVASSYSLSLMNQPEIGDKASHNRREPFPSMVAEGVAYATQALVETDASVTYCSPNLSKGCVPVAPVSINVVGEDGYWTLPSPRPESVATQPLPAAMSECKGSEALHPMPSPPELNVYPLPPLPVRVVLGTGLIGIVVLTHLVVLFLIRRELKKSPEQRAFLEWPFVRVLVPPQLTAVTGYHRLTLTICFALLALVAAWLAVVTVPFAASGGLANFMVMHVSALMFGGIVIATVSLYMPSVSPAPLVSTGGANAQAGAIAEVSPRSPLSICAMTGWLLFLGVVGTMSLLVLVTVELTMGRGDGEHRIVLARLVGGGILSPAALIISLSAAIYTAVFAAARRLSLVGFGYKALGAGSRAFALLADTAPPATGQPAETSSLATVLDMPGQHLPAIYPLAVLFALAAASVGAWDVSTIEGVTFSWFLRIGSLTALGLGLLLLAQGLVTWNVARSHLHRLARSPIEPHFSAIAQHVPWDISLAPPRLTELTPVARMADCVLRDFRTLSLAPSYIQRALNIRRQQDDFEAFRSDAELRIGVRGDDMMNVRPLFGSPCYVEILRQEMAIREHAALIQSTSWFRLWRLSDAIVSLLERSYWLRAKPDPAPDEGAESAELAGSAWRMVLGRRGGRLRASPSPPAPLAAGSRMTLAERERPNGEERDSWFARCEQFVALQMAFVLRDVVARTITCLFAAMLCLTFLTASHLFYSFNGRASMLTIDLLAVAAAALAAVWILVDMERDHVLSRLRTTTPGRIDVNWDFIKRIALYGVLPLLAVIASLFPEVGGRLFGWLEPLRKLSTF